MERLTYNFAVGENHCWQVHGADNLMCEEVCSQYSEKGCKECPIGKAIDRLAHYEDLEEQGRLVELPVKIGDTVYISHRRIDGSDCVRETEFWWSDIPQLNKTVFLSRPEAEAALAASGKEG